MIRPGAVAPIRKSCSIWHQASILPRSLPSLGPHVIVMPPASLAHKWSYQLLPGMELRGQIHFPGGGPSETRGYLLKRRFSLPGKQHPSSGLCYTPEVIHPFRGHSGIIEPLSHFSLEIILPIKGNR